VGKKLSGCGDLELTRAIRLSGWRLDREPRLRMHHFLPAHRLDWAYLRRLARGEAASQVMLAWSDPARKDELSPWFRNTRLCQAQSIIRSLLTKPKLLGAWLFSPREGDPNVIEAEKRIGTLVGLVQLCGRYKSIRDAARRFHNAFPAQDTFGKTALS
jgi:hypothetical protein